MIVWVSAGSRGTATRGLMKRCKYELWSVISSDLEETGLGTDGRLYNAFIMVTSRQSDRLPRPKRILYLSRVHVPDSPRIQHRSLLELIHLPRPRRRHGRQYFFLLCRFYSWKPVESLPTTPRTSSSPNRHSPIPAPLYEPPAGTVQHPPRSIHTPSVFTTN